MHLELKKYMAGLYIFLYYRYLEQELVNLSDPLEVAITAYALYLANSVAKESAFASLDRIKRYESELHFSERIPRM